MKLSRQLAAKLIVGVVILLAVIMLLGNKNDSHKIVPGQIYGTKKSACEIFHDFNAFQLFGNAPINVPKKDGVPKDTSKEYKASSCSYTPLKSTDEFKDFRASLLVLSPLTKHAVDENAKLFKDLPAGAEKVSGFGDKAYWDAKNGQMDVLKHKTRYVITFGKTNASDRTLEQTKKLAKILNVKL